MKSIKSLIAVLAIAISPAFAGQTVIDTSGLTEAQITELKIQALKAQQSRDGSPAVIEQAAKVSSVTRTEAEKWADFGKNIGTALVSTAKELGMAAVEFSKTDLGKIATFIIVYKLVGNAIVHFVAGLVLMFMLPTLIIAARRYIMLQEAKYEYQDWKLFGLIPYKKKVMVFFKKIDSDNAFWVFFWTCVGTLVSIGFSLFIMLSGS